jgi:hypothetical protein
LLLQPQAEAPQVSAPAKAPSELEGSGSSDDASRVEDMQGDFYISVYGSDCRSFRYPEVMWRRPSEFDNHDAALRTPKADHAGKFKLSQ